MSARLTVQPRCPVCTAPTEGDKCGLGCDIKRCDDCRELYAVGEGHECAETCDVCPELVDADARCTHGRSLCPECLTRCRDCRADFREDGGVNAAMGRWRG